MSEHIPRRALGAPRACSDPDDRARSRAADDPARLQRVARRGCAGLAYAIVLVPLVVMIWFFASITRGWERLGDCSRVQVQTNPLFDDPFFRRFFDLPELPRQREVLSAGSGAIVDAGRGYVLTNNHVIADAQEIQVTLRDRRTYPARRSSPHTPEKLPKFDARCPESLASPAGIEPAFSP